MKKKLKIITLLLLFFAFTSFAVHKFYVSVTQIDYIQNKNRVEITSRIFIDDFNKVLEKKYNKKIYLASNREISGAKELVKSYMLEKLKITINNQPHATQFLGTEIDNDVLICYLKVTFSEKITTFGIENSVLTEMFKEQQNLVHTDINNEKKQLFF